MELRELDRVLGELAVPRDRGDWTVYHTSTACPDVAREYVVLRPGDDGYGDVLELELCEWCVREWLGNGH